MINRRLLGAVATAAMLLSACSSGGSSSDTKGFSAQVASYDLSVGRDQRVIAGLLVDGGAKLVSFGSMDFAFAYRGTKDKPLRRPQDGPRANATFRPIPGQRLSGDTSAARIIEGSEGTGIYAADAVRFDAAGIWQLTVTGRVGTKALSVKTDFEVLERSAVPLPGEAAPRTENLLPGAEGAPVKAIDSRAEPDGRVPDPALHAQTVAAAIASGRPTMVVISTPVYCQSRFCGPITDSVQALADRYGDRMHFVHLEVWRDFEAQTVNKAAAEWIFRDRNDDIHEPWVFVVGCDGTVAQRFDNVASEDELQRAVEGAEVTDVVVEKNGEQTERLGRFRVAPPSPGQAVGLMLALLFLAGAVGYMIGGERPPGESSAEVGFLRDMTTHHDQAVEMANLAVERATEPLVRTFAREVLITQRYELGLMSAWLGEWGYGYDAERREAMAWMGVPTLVEEMPGMASAVQMDALRRAQGRQVDALFLAMMSEHHRGGADMAAAAMRVVDDADVRALAEAVARNQRIEINEYQGARQRLGL